MAGRLFDTTPLEQVKQLTTLNELEDTLALVKRQEGQLLNELDEQQQQHTELARVLDRLSELEDYVKELYDNSGELSNVLSRAVESGQEQTEFIRGLDTEQNKVKLAIEQIQDAQKLRDCIMGTLECLSLKDYDKAAVHLFRSTKLSVLNRDLSKLALPIGQEEESPETILNRARSELQRIIQDAFAEAVRNQDQESIRRFFKLFPMVGEDTLGLILYADFLCSLVSDRCKVQTDNTNQRNFSVKITELYEMVAMAVDHHYPLVETNYGPGRMLYVIYRIQREVDTQASILLDSFYEEYKVDKMLMSIEQELKKQKTSTVKSALGFVSGKPSNTASVSPPSDVTTDLRHLDSFLKELAVISQKTELYYRFIRRRTKAEVDSLSKEEVEQRADLKEATLALNDHYIQMERYFARKSVAKVIQLDEVGDGDKTSTSLEDVFFILKNCCQRAITLCHAGSGAPGLKLLVRILEVDYLRILHQRLMANTSQLDTKDICLNNMEVACDYMPKLANELQAKLNLLENIYSTDDLEVMKRTLNIIRALETKTRTILELQHKLRGLIQRLFKPTRYLLTEMGYEEQELNDNTGSRFVMETETLVEPFSKVLSATNWAIIYKWITRSILDEWETVLWVHLGALQVDKDIRVLNSFLSNNRSSKCTMTSERLERLNEINILLSMDDVDDITEMIDSSADESAFQRLSAHEIRRILLLRVEFSKDKIARLSL
ncbi:COG4 transport protein-domain-containing protein [Syncephalis fuscata]|nr:COG4 transport protein-domain-containing protein [Syncephalis fuscata]